MVSMLAKYLPGGVWTPAARTVALRRYAGVTDTPTVLASILVEAGLSAISGVIVFVVSLAWVRGVDAPLLPLLAFGLLSALALHPRVFRPLAQRLLRPFGAESIEPVPFGRTLMLLVFYCGTWLIAGAAVYFMLRSLGTNVGLATIPFLGGVSAVGAIVAVLAVFAPSGLGAREASMYGLLLAITIGGARARRHAAEPACDHARRAGALRRRSHRLAPRPSSCSGRIERSGGAPGRAPLQRFVRISRLPERSGRAVRSNRCRSSSSYVS